MTLLPWQLDLWTQLNDYKKQNRVPQALLINGAKGIGKLNLAELFAMSLLCQKPGSDGLACGNCKPCFLLTADSHPDLIKIYPEEAGKAITIGQIRLLLTQLNLKPQFDSYRVIIIHPAEQLNNAAANAFLKYLEEPTERTIVILVSNDLSIMPATILSRCQKLNIQKPDKNTVISWLRSENPHLSLTEAETIHRLSNGAPFQALDFSKTETMTIRNNCFNSWLEIAKQTEQPTVIAEKWHKRQIAQLLEWIATWLIDIIKCKYQINSVSLYNPDFKKQLDYLAQKIILADAFRLYDLVLISKQRSETQLNKQSMLEEILIGWYRINQTNS